jgi:hypothetical protein
MFAEYQWPDLAALSDGPPSAEMLRGVAYACAACRCLGIGDAASFKEHIESKKHKNKLASANLLEDPNITENLAWYVETEGPYRAERRRQKKDAKEVAFIEKIDRARALEGHRARALEAGLGEEEMQRRAEERKRKKAEELAWGNKKVKTDPYTCRISQARLQEYVAAIGPMGQTGPAVGPVSTFPGTFPGTSNSSPKGVAKGTPKGVSNCTLAAAGQEYFEPYFCRICKVELKTAELLLHHMHSAEHNMKAAEFSTGR